MSETLGHRTRVGKAAEQRGDLFVFRLHIHLPATRCPCGAPGRQDVIDLDTRDTCHKSVAAPRNRGDELVIVGTLAEHPAQREDLLREIAFLDGGVGPQLLDQIGLLDEPSLPFDQREERVEGLDGQGHSLAAPQQDAPVDIDSKRLEIVEARGLHREIHVLVGWGRARLKSF